MMVQVPAWWLALVVTALLVFSAMAVMAWIHGKRK